MQTFFLSLSTLVALSRFGTASNCGETTALVCYNGENGSTPQNVSLDDIAYAASYLRYIGQSNTGLKQFWTMASSFSCQEYELPTNDDQTVLPLADHLDGRYNSSVLYTELANAIDGGENPTAAQKAKSLLGACGSDGGMVGVTVNTSDPAYQSAAFKGTGNKPGGILVKIVRAPGS